jgi:hypothetical protein
VGVETFPPFFYKGFIMSGKKYFYALGQSARARGMSKVSAENFYCVESMVDYARIAFDKGYRGLSI